MRANKVALVGLTSKVEIFMMVGIKVFKVDDENHAQEVIKELVSSGFSLIFIENKLYNLLIKIIESIPEDVVISQMPI